ncbi:diacylglycerol kinase [Candidatus Saccharibacteria bacterium]|nr:MAG: diacylglycerol kinase [Candidatus Saccharibacteria bacterium]
MKSVKQFSLFAIIFNPNSTGDAPSIAKRLRHSLQSVADKRTIRLVPTEYAGHAEMIAYDIACSEAHPLIISVSGDGGYNEVINGVRRAKADNKAKDPVVTVVGAGNANDHYRVVHKRSSLLKRLDKAPRSIDLIRVDVLLPDGKSLIRYAHSYVGVGITPLVAEELNRHKLHPLKELQIIVKTLLTSRSTKIRQDGHVRAVDSLIFANIQQMAKVLTLNDSNSLHDGKFEVVELPHTNIFGLLRTLITSATVGLKAQPKREEYTFTLLKKGSLQVDGELLPCEAESEITVTVAKDAVQILL